MRRKEAESKQDELRLADIYNKVCQEGTVSSSTSAVVYLLHADMYMKSFEST